MKKLDKDIALYLNMPSVPSGAVLNRIIKKRQLSQVELASKTGILPQRINDLIMGRRRFTPEISIQIEIALGIECEGLFYIIQANHDVYLSKMRNCNRKPNLSILSSSTFWDVDLQKVDWNKGRDWAIARVLEYGNREEVEEMCRFYGINAVKKIANQSNRFRLYEAVMRNSKYIIEKEYETAL
ncbi:MAG: helix-turn-helix transcriptional regulator [Bacteroidales bacterium]|nr:helix-turn-helix transcriptional regulator [Bacteroidales bacterium]